MSTRESIHTVIRPNGLVRWGGGVWQWYKEWEGVEMKEVEGGMTWTLQNRGWSFSLSLFVWIIFCLQAISEQKVFALALLFKPCLIDISVGHNQGYIFYRYFTFYILKYLESLKLFKVFEINASAYKGCIYLIEKYIKAVMN